MSTGESLARLGFGEYETRAYVALLQHGAVSGYELAKVSGIPRANIYAVLQKLEERGAVVRIESPDGTRYAPLPADELLGRVESAFKQSLDDARGELAQVARPVEAGFVWSVTGYDDALGHARALLAQAERELLLGIFPDEATALAGAIAEAEGRGVALTTLCMGACSEVCGGCKGDLYRLRALEDDAARRLLVLADGQEVLTVEIKGAHDTAAIRARQPVLVELTSWFIRHSIMLATLINALGDKMSALLGQEAQRTFAAMRNLIGTRR